MSGATRVRIHQFWLPMDAFKRLSLVQPSPAMRARKQYKGLYNGWALSYFQALAHVQAPLYVSHRVHQRKWPLSSHRAQATLNISKGSVFYLQQFTPLRFYLVRSKTSAHVERACLPSAPSAGQGGRCDALERA